MVASEYACHLPMAKHDWLQSIACCLLLTLYLHALLLTCTIVCNLQQSCVHSRGFTLLYVIQVRETPAVLGG